MTEPRWAAAAVGYLLVAPRRECRRARVQAAAAFEFESHRPTAHRCALLCAWMISIEVFFLRPAVKKAIILLLFRADIKVLKDALAHLGPYQTLTLVRYSDPGR